MTKKHNINERKICNDMFMMFQNIMTDMMNCRISFLLLSLLPFLSSYGMPYEETDHKQWLSSNCKESEIRHGVSHAEPIDLFGVDNKALPSYAIGRQDAETSKSCVKSVLNAQNLVGFKAVTNDYGQLKSILEANKGNEIDSLVVVGPMNKDDFKAIWDCAVYGNMQVLNLENATMENNAIPDYAMYDPIQFDTGFWLKMRRIILPEGIVRIGKAAFPYMGIEEINIPSTVREIGSTAFGYDRWLNCEIVIPEGVEEIKYQTFIECFRLTIEPRLPKSLKRIGEHAFSISRFSNISFPDGLEEISQCAFQNSALIHLSIPETCLTIGPMAFQSSWALEEINLPENLESISSGLFKMCTSLEKLKINNKCKHIEADAFLCCFKLSDVSFNQSLESIGKNAFQGCALTVVNLPPTLQRLGISCFSYMSSTLHEVRCAAQIPPVCAEDPQQPVRGPFSVPDKDEEFTLYVPYGTKTAYSTTMGWDCFFKIEETDDFPFAGIYDATIYEKNKDNCTYDLFGRKVETLTPGQVYIRNGKKFLKR